MKKPSKKLSQAGLIHPIVAVILSLLLAVPVGFYGIYLYLAPTLPNTELLKSSPIETPMQVYTKDGKLIGEFGEKLSIPVTYNQIPLNMVHAFLAAEDASFFTHSGISFKGLGRAVAEAVQGGGAQTGGSTITMQVAKNFYLSPERTLKRKLTEIFLAREIEQNLTKPEILTLYVNKIFLGQHAYGIAAAARVYYNKPLSDLTIAEMAMIAGLPKAPSKYNPVVNPERALERRNWIIGRMLQLGFINKNQYDTAVHAPIGLHPYEHQLDMNAPYLAEMARSEMVEKFGDNILNSGWKVYTTVSSIRQKAADEAVKAGLEAYDHRHGWYGPEELKPKQTLASFYPIGSMYPAQVTKVQARRIEVQLQDGRIVPIEWSGLSWARKFKDVDRTGGAPSNAAQLVKVGDIIRAKPIIKTTSKIIKAQKAKKDAKGNITTPAVPEQEVITQDVTWVLGQVPRVQGQLVSLDPQDGALQAVVGGYDFSGSKFNRSIQGWRQPGSTIKPFIYSLALERGYSPNSTVMDTPIHVGSWEPQNSDGRFLGPIPLRRALYLSRNMVSIHLLQAVGVENARTYISHFGLVKSELPPTLSLALGTAQVVPLQIATGYSAFANGGFRIQPYFIDHINDYNGKQMFKADPARVCYSCGSSTLVEEHNAANAKPLIEPVQADAQGNAITAKPVDDNGRLPVQDTAGDKPFKQAPRIMKPNAAYDMASILRDVVQKGTGRAALKIGRNDIGGKTGTTNDAKDAWFSGFHPTLVAVAWVGYDQPAGLGRSEFGGIAALPIWAGYMEKALEDTPKQWVARDGRLQKIPLSTEEQNKRDKREAERAKADAIAKAPPLPTVVPRPIAPPPPAPSPVLAGAAVAGVAVVAAAALKAAPLPAKRVPPAPPAVQPIHAQPVIKPAPKPVSQPKEEKPQRKATNILAKPEPHQDTAHKADTKARAAHKQASQIDIFKLQMAKRAEHERALAKLTQGQTDSSHASHVNHAEKTKKPTHKKATAPPDDSNDTAKPVKQQRKPRKENTDNANTGAEQPTNINTAVPDPF